MAGTPTIRYLRDENATLRAEVERLRSDRARLDWIAAEKAKIHHDDDPELSPPFGWIVSTPSVDGVGVRDDLREAIDQAMRESVPTSTPTPTPGSGTGTQSNETPESGDGGE